MEVRVFQSDPVRQIIDKDPGELADLYRSDPKAAAAFIRKKLEEL